MTGDLFHYDGSRKYLTQDERQAFLTAGDALSPHRAFILRCAGPTRDVGWPRPWQLTADRVDLNAVV